MSSLRFRAYCRRKEDAALSAELRGYETVAEDTAGGSLISFGNAWTRKLFDGEFYRCAGPPSPDLPALSLLVPRPASDPASEAMPSKRRNATCTHLIREGLSRVEADAVLVGVGAAQELDVVFSVWHPELVALRLASGRPRHPTQVVVMRNDMPFEHLLLFQEPTLRVVIVTRRGVAQAARERLRNRPWIEVIDAGEPLSLHTALTQLRASGNNVISAVDGERLASALLRERLVTDLYLTMSLNTAGHRPFYDGPPLVRRRLLVKAGKAGEEGLHFEHLVPPRVFS